MVDVLGLDRERTPLDVVREGLCGGVGFGIGAGVEAGADVERGDVL